MKTIGDAYLTQLRMQQAVRDSAAHALGAASVEFEIGRARIVADGDQKLLRLGALFQELEGHRARCMGIITRSQKETDALGAAAVREIGVDPDAVTFTLDLVTGQVLLLRGEAWVEA